MNVVQTCGACPEQYDVFDNGRRVGYMRLRHGSFTVDCPDACGLCVLSGHPVGDGIFAEDEREYWLGKGLEAIEAWLASVRHPVGYCDKCNSDSRAYYRILLLQRVLLF